MSNLIADRSANPDFATLLIKARKEVYTLLGGRSLTSVFGEGYDFAELREYRPGDDVRKINWNITAKTGTPYVKELHALKELSVALAVIADGSVYAGKTNAKQRTMAEAAAILGYAALYGNDLFEGFAFLPETTLRTYPTKETLPMERFVSAFAKSELLHTRNDTQKALDTLFGLLQRPSLLFVIADFLDPVDLSLLAQKHDVVAIVVRDPAEIAPPQRTRHTFRDPRTGESFERTLSASLFKRYRANYLAHEERLLRHFYAHNIRYALLRSDKETLAQLLALSRR